MILYPFANRYRGSGHKLAGCLLLSAPSCVAYSATWGVGYAVVGFACWWAVLAFCTLTIIKVMLMFRWWHDSEAWRDGVKMRRQWFWKGLVGFMLLGWPFGWKMQDCGNVYGEAFSHEDTGTKEAIEYTEGRLFGKHEEVSTLLHLSVVAIYYLWRVYG